ncbi:replication factor a2 [Colletotrichum scovillei]|uniref:Replication factor a2 n=1 Tax=Colletotrichum scovillei TaxID=1209932 RepID=A0A9P7R2K4_9PEZI|nr:replication factor a2 [Colletotrichum scovillei]KAG7068096.1 replication factor a2 [Colletotrichum scovillei]
MSPYTSWLPNLVIEDSPSLVVNGGVNQTLGEQLVRRIYRSPHSQARTARNLVQVHALVAAGGIVDKVEHLLRVRRDTSKLGGLRGVAAARRRTTGAVSIPTVDEHAVLAASCTAVRRGTTAVGVEGSLCEVEVDVGGLEEVVVDLVEVGDGADKVRADVAFAVERLEAAPDADVALELELLVGVVLFIRVDPLLDLDEPRAVVELEGDVCGLGRDLADLGDEGDLGDGGAVDLEVGARVGFLGVDDLLDCDGAEGFFAVGFSAAGALGASCAALGAAVDEAACVVAAACAVGGFCEAAV